LGQDLPNELHLFWYYPGSPLPNSPAAIASLPDQAPVNYYFHHHLGINLQKRSTWLEIVSSPFVWQPQNCRAKVAFQECLEIAIPWVDLHKPPDTQLHILGILAEQGEYHSFVPTDSLIVITIP
jgi:alpha-amylase/alpha-mannosidase (GH57 family)